MELSQVRLEDMQMIVLPGGGVGVTNLGNDERVENLVKQAHEQGKTLCAICAAPSLLSKWGLLEGKKAVCYPTWSDRIPDAHYLPGEKLAQDGSIVTGQAAGTSFEFGLKLIEVLSGSETADRVRKEIYL
jgi:4-methyl-5(b-hydroxyethyl)-thiazole monophosphate biosynthesis